MAPTFIGDAVEIDGRPGAEVTACLQDLDLG
jgi:hypothetical protein